MNLEKMGEGDKHLQIVDHAKQTAICNFTIDGPHFIYMDLALILLSVSVSSTQPQGQAAHSPAC